MKKLIAFLLCFTLLAVGVTYGCIQYTLRTPEEEKSAFAGIDLNGFYDENDLVINSVSLPIGDNGGSYPQIDGLKNSEVQDAINQTICGEADRLQQKYLDLGTKISYLNWNESANFANVLSIGMYSGDDAMHNEQVYLNFNLNDGSLLRLSDLFAADADLQGIVRAAFYDTMTIRNMSNAYWEELNYPDEQALYKTVRGYLASEDPKFAFTPANIYLYYGEDTATVDMTAYADEIVVYSKFLSEESLFAEDGIGYEDLFTCTELPESYAQRKFGFAAENFWYDIALSEAYLEEDIPEEQQRSFLAFYEELYTSLLAEVDAVHATAMANPDRAYILLANPYVNLYRDSMETAVGFEVYASGAAEVNENYKLYEMPMELFESKYQQELVELYRTGTYTMFYSGLDDAIDGDEVQVVNRNSYRLFNYETGQEMTLEDLFADGYDYMDAIRRNKKYTLTSYYGYTLESAELALQNAWCEIEGTGLRVYLPEWGTEQYLYMPLSEFPRTALTIFK